MRCGGCSASDKQGGSFLSHIASSARRILWRALRAFRAENYEDAAKLFRRYLTLPDAVWQKERCTAMLCLAGCCHAEGFDDQTERWLLRACAELPSWSVPWDCAAAYYRSMGQTDAASVCTDRAKK